MDVRSIGKNGTATEEEVSSLCVVLLESGRNKGARTKSITANGE